jgi:RNA polymerase sigma-70 factor (ECF subfamily)
VESSFFTLEGRPLLQDETPEDKVQGWQDFSDLELIDLAQAGEADAFGELYFRHANTVFRFIFAHVSDLQDAEDLTSEVFYRAWRTVSNYRDQGVPFLAYLFRIARNVLVDFYRRSGRSGGHMSIEDKALPDNNPDPDESVTTQLEQQELRQTLDRLREDYRTVLVLRFLSGLTPEETGQVMGRTPGAVRILQHRALAALRNLLEL